MKAFSHVQHSATPWTTAGQASLSITSSRGLLTLTSFVSAMPSSRGTLPVHSVPVPVCQLLPCPVVLFKLLHCTVKNGFLSFLSLLVFQCVICVRSIISLLRTCDLTIQILSILFHIQPIGLVGWLTLLALQTNRTYTRALGMELAPLQGTYGNNLTAWGRL